MQATYRFTSACGGEVWRGGGGGDPKAGAPFGARSSVPRAGYVSDRERTVNEAGRGLVRTDAVSPGRCWWLREASSRDGSTGAFVPKFRNTRANRHR
jgi:hypothetical protein